MRATVARLGVLCLPAMAAGAGYVLAFGASRFGDAAPIALLGLVLLPVLAVAVIDDPVLGLMAVTLVAPLGVHQVPGTPFELVQVVVLAVITLTVIPRLATDEPPLEWPRPLWWLVGLCAWTLMAFPLSPDRSVATRIVAGFVLEVLFAGTVATACRTTFDVQRALTALVLTAGAVGISAPLSAGQVTAQYGGSLITGRFSGIFVEPNQMGTFSAVGALVAVGLALGGATRLIRWLAIAGGIGCLAGMLFTLSRGAWIGFTMGVVVLLFSVPAARRALLGLAVPVIVVAVAFGAFAPSNPQVQVVGERIKSITGERNPYDNRPAIWAEAIRLTNEKPLLGHGPGSYAVVSVLATSESRPTFAEHAHNVLLTFAVEEGLPAVALLLAFTAHLALLISRAGRRYRDARRHRDAALLAGLAAALVAVAGQGLVDYTLRNAVVLTSVFFVLGALLRMIELAPSSAPVPSAFATVRRPAVEP